MNRIFLVFFFLISCSPKSTVTDYVDPFIGTDGTGHTFPGATTPFGMVQLSPDTKDGGWDNCSGYHSSNSTILGFSHTHLSGTGAIDYGDILIKLQKIIHLDKDQFLNISSFSRDRIIKSFSKSQMVKNYFNLYEQASIY